MRSVQELYGEIWGEDDPELDASMNASLHPRGSDVLFDMFGGLGVGEDDLVVDVGCRDAHYAIELVRRFGCLAVAVDPVPLHVERARARVVEAALQDRVVVVQAGIEALPLDDASVDYIWCRDVLNHVDLAPGLDQCFRVLRPGGAMLVYQTFATELLEPREAARLYQSIAIVPANMSPGYFEAIASHAGFEIALHDPIDSEWRERWIEEGDRETLDDLLRLARLRRSEADLIHRVGRARYEAAYGGLLWGVYQMLGKLCPTVYVLRKPAEPHSQTPC